MFAFMNSDSVKVIVNLVSSELNIDKGDSEFSAKRIDSDQIDY